MSGDRLDVDQVVDPQWREVAGGKGRIKDLDELEDFVRMLARDETRFFLENSHIVTAALLRGAWA